jgi:thioredoxin-like negative regulator of GroEL
MLIQNIISYDDFINYIQNYKCIIVNISAIWCKPCIALKPDIEKFISVIDEINIIYLKLDESIYGEDDRFQNFFGMSKIPYFAFIKDSKIIDKFVSGDFNIVSKRLFEHISKEKNLLIQDFKLDDDF